MTPFEQRIAELYPWVNQAETPIPLAWNPKDKFNHISLAQNNTRMMYKGPGKSQKDAAACRATHPIPVSCGLYYYEVKVLSKGKEGYIGVGFSLEDVNNNRLPGWDKGSYGYHGDDGHSFWSSGSGRPYGPTFTTGDIVGCGVDMVHNRCFYTLNGRDLGIAFTDLPPNLYPCVGLQSAGETVETNFGQNPFVFDVDMARKELMIESRLIIARFSPKLSRGEWEQTLQRVVLDYLVHNGYHASAEAFSKSSGLEVKEATASMANRQNIQRLVLEGRISDAIAMTSQLFPGVLEKNPGLLFRLKVRQFIEMVSGADEGDNEVSYEVKAPTRHNRTPSPRDMNKNGSSRKTDRSAAQQFEYDMDTELVEEEPLVDLNISMDVDNTTVTVADGDKHANGDSVAQSMDFEDDDDEENRPPFILNAAMLTRTLMFGKHLHEFFAEMRLDQGRNNENQKLLADAFSLMAYSDPWASPLKHLLDHQQREPVAAALNSSILVSVSTSASRPSMHPSLKVLLGMSKRMFPVLAKKGNGVIGFENVFSVLKSLDSMQVDTKEIGMLSPFSPSVISENNSPTNL
ncbi:hypothetical protein RvY_14784 [Ramazzottius varieornatus]|uniref:B30.2/SPRY domain-containing protein n=1 Tax=Ramazzottius varieornatus TaxID=947166 RepID=A0A1D1VSI9_RAMVA|nr:hypothetical protein RvY_14784 [Ramazzottius varieornatus]